MFNNNLPSQLSLFLFDSCSSFPSLVPHLLCRNSLTLQLSIAAIIRSLVMLLRTITRQWRNYCMHYDHREVAPPAFIQGYCINKKTVQYSSSSFCKRTPAFNAVVLLDIRMKVDPHHGAVKICTKSKVRLFNGECQKIDAGDFVYLGTP